MEIISHRGYWHSPEEKNTSIAFQRSFSLGFGTETDFRDCGGQLVISHDPAHGGALPVADVLAKLAAINRTLPLAINIKADGLQEMIKAALTAAHIENYFLFDMSVPDALQSLKAGLRCYTRHSDVELHPPFYAQAAGVWLDAFAGEEWITDDVLGAHLRAGKKVCLVSPELHRRPHAAFWRRLKASPFSVDTQLTLCTDLPEEARGFFAQ
jgi:hypothetical protein